MTRAEVWHVPAHGKHTRIGEVARELPDGDREAWLLVLRDFCRARRRSIDDYEIRVPLRVGSPLVHRPH